MSYHGTTYRRMPTPYGRPYHLIVATPGMGQTPFTPTTAFAESVDPYSWRFSPPGAIYAPYGWGPDFNVGMPFNYTHHLDYVQQPVRRRVRGTRRIGPMYDVLSGSWSGGHPGGPVNTMLAGILAVL